MEVKSVALLVVNWRPVLTLEVGEIAPDGLSRYVRVSRDARVLTIANYQIDGLLALLAPAR